MIINANATAYQGCDVVEILENHLATHNGNSPFGGDSIHNLEGILKHTLRDEFKHYQYTQQQRYVTFRFTNRDAFGEVEEYRSGGQIIARIEEDELYINVPRYIGENCKHVLLVVDFDDVNRPNNREIKFIFRYLMTMKTGFDHIVFDPLDFLKIRREMNKHVSGFKLNLQHTDKFLMCIEILQQFLAKSGITDRNWMMYLNAIISYMEQNPKGSGIGVSTLNPTMLSHTMRLIVWVMNRYILYVSKSRYLAYRGI